jgi:hypothetical protein
MFHGKVIWIKVRMLPLYQPDWEVVVAHMASTVMAFNFQNM